MSDQDKAALARQAVPDEFVRVPMYPTSEMIDAGRWSEYAEESSRLREVDDDEVAGVWAAMLAAAPAAPQASQAPAPADGSLHLGACLTDGKLHATVMRRELNGHITVVATAEIAESSLRAHDCHAVMAPAATCAAVAHEATLTINAPNGDKMVCHGTALDMMTLDKFVKAAVSQVPAQPNGETQAAPQASQAAAVGEPQTAPKSEPVTLADVLDALNVFNRPKPSEDDGPWEAEHFIRVDYLPAFINTIAAAWFLPRAAAPQAEQQAGRRNRKEDQLIYSVLLSGWQKGEPLTQIAERVADALAAQQAEREPLSQAAQDVLAERQRQISVEGWTPEHDDEHADGALSAAAMAYLDWVHGEYQEGAVPLSWPAGWALAWFKPSDDERNLVKAAALILAELERRYRAHGIGHHVPGRESQP